MSTKYLRQEFAKRANSFRESFSEESGNDGQFKAYVDQIISELEAKQAKSDVMFNHFDKVGIGATFANSRKQYAIVLPDATHQGSYRSQYFDSRGFFSHSTRPTLDEVIFELCEDGYDQVVPSDTLTIMSQTPEWERGMAKLAVIQAVQDGRISWQEAEKRSQEIDLKYDPDLVAA